MVCLPKKGTNPIFFFFLETVQSGQPNKEVATLRKRVQELGEENNMLKFKVDALLDMVCFCRAAQHDCWQLAVSKADFQVLEKELEAARPAAAQSTPRR